MHQTRTNYTLNSYDLHSTVSSTRKRSLGLTPNHTRTRKLGSTLKVQHPVINCYAVFWDSSYGLVMFPAILPTSLSAKRSCMVEWKHIPLSNSASGFNSQRMLEVRCIIHLSSSALSLWHFVQNQDMKRTMQSI